MDDNCLVAIFPVDENGVYHANQIERELSYKSKAVYVNHEQVGKVIMCRVIDSEMGTVALGIEFFDEYAEKAHQNENGFSNQALRFVTQNIDSRVQWRGNRRTRLPFGIIE